MKLNNTPQMGRRGARAGARRYALYGVCTLLMAVFFVMQPAPWNVEQAEAGATVYNISENSHMGRMRITSQKSETIEVDQSFAEVLVGDPEIADVLPMTNHTIYIPRQTGRFDQCGDLQQEQGTDRRPSISKWRLM